MLKWTTPTLLWRSISGLRKKKLIGVVRCLTETAKYGKIWYDEDVHDLRFVETEFPAIVFNDTISFDESDDEDYTVIYDENSFSYKIISVNNLKTDFKNDNDKVNMPSLLSPEPKVSYSNDLDFFKDFENEFPSIVYNDALTSKSDFLTEHIEQYGVSKGLGYGVLIPDLAETMIRCMLKKTCVELIWAC
ncbi:hypothetical protein Tco_0451535 [Tanacetum coccineum]